MKVQQKEMANRIKARRAGLGFTQEQFAEIIGISYSSYVRIENAFQNPALKTLIKIAKNLDLTLDYIVFGEDNGKLNDVTDAELLKALIDFSDSDKLKHASEVLNKIVKLKS